MSYRSSETTAPGEDRPPQYSTYGEQEYEVGKFVRIWAKHDRYPNALVQITDKLGGDGRPKIYEVTEINDGMIGEYLYSLQLYDDGSRPPPGWRASKFKYPNSVKFKSEGPGGTEYMVRDHARWHPDTKTWTHDISGRPKGKFVIKRDVPEDALFHALSG